MTGEYVRLTTVDHAGKSETLKLRVLAEDGSWLRGLKVDAEGADTESHYDENGVLVVVERLIDKGTIRKRVPLVMNNHYGTLEPDSGAA